MLLRPVKNEVAF